MLYSRIKNVVTSDFRFLALCPQWTYLSDFIWNIYDRCASWYLS